MAGLTRRWTGANDAGSREYTAEEYGRVLASLRRHVGAANATTAAEIARETGIEGRTLRAIFSDIDGVDLLLAFDGAKLYVAEHADDAEAFTRRLASQARKMSDRAQRRMRFARRLSTRRPTLWLTGEERDGGDL